MYIDLGEHKSIPLKYVTGFFDLDFCTQNPSGDSLLFLERAQEQGLLYDLTTDFPRTLILTLEGLYISSISLKTLNQRYEEAKRKETKHAK